MAPSPAAFALDPQLVRDTHMVGDLPLCRVLLMNDASYPWLILVPRRAGVSEIVDLAAADHAQLWTEIAQASRALKHTSRCDKLNVAAIGNVVAQLHVHIVARSRGDPAWPKPVWGAGAAKPYDEASATRLIGQIKTKLALAAI